MMVYSNKPIVDLAENVKEIKGNDFLSVGFCVFSLYTTQVRTHTCSTLYLILHKISMFFP